MIGFWLVYCTYHVHCYYEYHFSMVESIFAPLSPFACKPCHTQLHICVFIQIIKGSWWDQGIVLIVYDLMGHQIKSFSYTNEFLAVEILCFWYETLNLLCLYSYVYVSGVLNSVRYQFLYWIFELYINLSVHPFPEWKHN